jgi:hypothetical protein
LVAERSLAVQADLAHGVLAPEALAAVVTLHT